MPEAAPAKPGLRATWRAFRETLPDAIEVARPQARLWLLGLLLVLVNRAAGLVYPAAPKYLFDDAIPNGDRQLLVIIVAVTLGATIVQAGSSFALTQTISKAGQRLIAGMRKRIHAHVTRLPIRYFDNHKVGDVLSRVMNDVDGLRNLLGTGMVDLLGGLFTVVVTLGILLWLNWKLTLIILVFLAVFGLVMAKAFAHLRPIFKRRMKLRGDVNGRLAEGLGGMRVVRAFNAEPIEQRTVARLVDDFLANIIESITATSTIALASSALVGLLGAVIMLVGGLHAINGEFPTGQFVSYVLYVGIMVGPIIQVMSIVTQLGEAFAGLERMRETLALPPEEPDAEAKRALPSVEGRVEVQGAGFEYEAGKPVLHDVDLVAEPGSVTAFVGPSGSGKTTLLGLLAAFHKPTRGRVLVDGVDLETVRLTDYRAHLGCVLQDDFLFAGPIRENIRYARPNATDEEVERAARLAHCMEFVERLPEGLGTIIGERGVKLSGGQRQRVTIARAILADPRILLLDEATSALDTRSEQAIQAGLAELMAGRTTFVIAHRLSTIRHAAQILVLEGGRVVERGTHDELMALGGQYHAMYRRQHRIEENLFAEPEAGDEGDDVKEWAATLEK